MKKIILHPLLFAIYPIIFLYSHNAQEVLLKQTLVPIIISLSCTLILWALIRILLKDNKKAGLVTTLFIISFFVYGYMFSWLTELNLFAGLHMQILPSVMFLLSYIAYFISKIKNESFLTKSTAVLNIVISILVVTNLSIILSHQAKKLYGEHKQSYPSESNTQADAKSNYPDIYYIILDEYASLETIKDIWKYDNSSFAARLKKNGFNVGDMSVKYDSTTKALPSYLNMNYVEEDISTSDAYQMLNNNKVFSYLKERGYTTVAFDSWYSVNPAKGLMNVDHNFNYVVDSHVSYMDAFSELLISNTMLIPFKFLFELQYKDVDDVHRASTQFTFDKIVNLPQVESPKFIYAHILCPHTPFTFNQDGGAVDPENKYNWNEKKYYLDQYVYISKKIEEMITSILNNSEKAPIIIVQSDHGPRPQYGQEFSQRFEIPKIHMHKVFFAYYLPYSDKITLQDNLSPINIFELIFNTYFDDYLRISGSD